MSLRIAVETFMYLEGKRGASYYIEDLLLARSRTWEDAARKTLAVCAEAAGA